MGITKSIELFVNPLVSNSSFFKKDFIKTIDYRVYLHEKFTVNQEVGFNFIFSKNEIWKFGIGSSYKNYSYSFNSVFQISSPIYENSSNQLLRTINHNNSLNINAIGFRGIVRRNLFSSTTMSLIIEFNKPISVKTNTTIVDEDFGTINYGYNERLSPNIKSMDHYIIPELNFNTKIYTNLFLNYGFKMRFWRGKESLYTFEIETKNEPDKYTLLDYRINTRQLGFYLGLNYQFNLPTNKK
tara:strand:- start:411 stop:1133 length:723 start_codon:yes stop_codon:yes gene_type:complete